MKERPILFSAPMVRAILEGRKTVTRRVCNGQRELSNEHDFRLDCCPYGQPGARLWVRETHSIYPAHGQHRADGLRWGPWAGLPTVVSPDGTQIAYFREGFDRSDPGRWRPSIHMPRWASRITLEVTGVRVERLQDITPEQILAEGVQIPATPEGQALIDISTKHGAAHFLPRLDGASTADLLRAHWAALWVQINGIDSWHANPWVWVVEFKRLEQPHA